MGIRIIFDMGALITAGAKQQPTANNLYQEIRLDSDFKINLPDNGDPFVDIGGRIEQFEMPSRLIAVSGCIKYFSWHVTIPHTLGSPRRQGFYQLKSANGTLTRTNNANSSSYELELRATSASDLQRLQRLVCEGKIWPVGDYEAVMVPSPLRNVRALLRELWEVIRRDVSLRFHRA